MQKKEDEEEKRIKMTKNRDEIIKKINKIKIKWN